MGSTFHSSEYHISGQPSSLPDSADQPTLVTGAVSLSKRRKRSPWSTRRKVIVFSCLGLLLLALGIITPLLYHMYTTRYQQDKTIAQDGVRHLQTAEGLLKNVTKGSLDTKNIVQAKQEFAQAFSSFNQVGNEVKQVPTIATSVPKLGSLLGSAQKLIPLALEVSQAGMIGCDALNILVGKLHGTLDAKSQGLTMKDLTAIQNDFVQLQKILNTATGQIQHLQPSDLQIDARLGPAVAAFKTESTTIQTAMQNAQSLLTIAPTLLGIDKSSSFLVEQLDSTEIRPGGGFIGSYGIATISDGRLANVHMQDTYLLDNTYTNSGHIIPYPANYTWFPLANSWSLRDSNLDADFPTAARYGEQLYQTEGGSLPLQGVIAITPWFIQNALKITGPIAVPEYNETITADNLVDRIHYYQLQAALNTGEVASPDGHSSLRKRFTEILFEHFFDRVRQIAPTKMSQFVTLFSTSLQAKDLQVYLNAAPGENLLQQYQLASEIQAPAGDSLMVVDANVQSSKSNYFITYNLQDQVTLDAAGNAVHHTTLTYNWPASNDNLQNDYGRLEAYSDYLRLYLPAGSTVQSQTGWAERGTSVAFNREVVAGLFTLSYNQSGTVDLTWTDPGAAKHDASGWHYHYLLQRQAGLTWHLNLPITLPSCSHNVQTVNKLTFDKGHSATIDQDLSKDLNVGVDYKC